MVALRNRLVVVAALLLVAACSGTTASVGDGDASCVACGADSGIDAAPASVTCRADGGTSQTGGDPSVKQHLSGTNGEFDDACDAQGNLIDHSCETAQACGPGPNPSCTSYETGKVATENVDCAGMCVDGACDGRCPKSGDIVTFVASSASGATITNDAQSRRYSCTVLFDDPRDSFDCKTGPMLGTKGHIIGLGLRGGACTGKDFGNIGVLVDGVTSPSGQSCSFGCSIIR